MALSFGCEEEEKTEEKQESKKSVAAPTSSVSSSSTQSGSSVPPGSGGLEVIHEQPVILDPTGATQSPFLVSGSCTLGSFVTLSGEVPAENVEGDTTVNCGDGTFTFPVSLENGSYLVSVTSSMGSSQVETYEATIVVDSTAPSAPSITNPPSNSFLSGSNILSIVGICEDDASIILSGAVEEEVSCDQGAFSYDFDADLHLGAGTYTFSLKQVDLVGNISAETLLVWTYDTSVPPEVTVNQSSPSHSSIPSLELSGTCEDGNLVILSGDGNDSIVCATSSFLFNLSCSIPCDGVRNYQVVQQNEVSNNSAPVFFTWIHDSQSPLAPEITVPASSPYVAAGPLNISGNCELDADVNLVGVTPSTISLQQTCSDGSFNFSFDELVDGNYQYNLNQTDLAGNISVTSNLQWTRANEIPSAPVVTSHASPYTSSEGILTIVGTCTDGFIVKLYDEIPADLENPLEEQTCATNVFSFSVDKSAEIISATYSYAITQFNGNMSAETQFVWARDIDGPVVEIISQPSSPNANSSSQFVFSSNESGISFECKVDELPWEVCSSPYTRSDLENGTHTFQVRGVDPLGNIGNAVSASWTQAAYQTLALYHMNSDGVGLDAGFNGNDLNGSVQLGVGKFGEGADFERNLSQSLNAPISSSLSNLGSQMTIDFWFNFEDTGHARNDLFTFVNVGDTDDHMFSVKLLKSNGNKFKIHFYGSEDGVNISSVVSNNISLTGWHHIAVTFDRGSVAIFFGGSNVGAGTIGVAGQSTLHASTSFMRVGEDRGADFFDGVIDELRISQVIRYTSQFTPENGEYTVID